MAALSATGFVSLRRPIRAALVFSTVLAVMGCADGKPFNPFKPKANSGGEVSLSTQSVKLIERDVEAPDVFQVAEAGLWDGRPSLGGVWVAHPDVQDPERVIIRNSTNDKFVIGALFRREREAPGPRLQVSSDAAAALGMLAGQPINLNVTALRRESVTEEPPAEALVAASLDGPSDVSETALDPIASAASAIEDAPDTAPAATGPIQRASAKPADVAAAAAIPAAAKATAPAAKKSSLKKPYVQVGIFSIETNAKNTAAAMRSIGIVPTVRKQSSKGKTFWRVVIGPAQSGAEQSDILKKVKSKGFTDAYPVTN